MTTAPRLDGEKSWGQRIRGDKRRELVIRHFDVVFRLLRPQFPFSFYYY